MRTLDDQHCHVRRGRSGGGVAMPASAAPQYYGSSAATAEPFAANPTTVARVNAQRRRARGAGTADLQQRLHRGSHLGIQPQRDMGWAGLSCGLPCRGLRRWQQRWAYGNNYGSNGYGNEPAGPLRIQSTDAHRTCPMDTRGGVQLVRKISRAAACIEGRNWGYNRNGVWVSQGCRAEFPRVATVATSNSGGYYGNNHGIGGRLFRCESIDGAPRECAANTRAGVQLVRQLSSAPCIQGRTWGYGRNGIWVSQGCRAEFRSVLSLRARS